MSDLKKLDTNTYEYRGQKFPKPYADFSSSYLEYVTKITWEEVDRKINKQLVGESEKEVLEKATAFIDSELDK